MRRERETRHGCREAFMIILTVIAGLATGITIIILTHIAVLTLGV